MSAILGLPASVVYATVAIYALLVIASIVVGVLRWKNPGERYSELASRTDSWWWMIGAFTLCILLNQTVAIFFLAFISYLALKEYLSLIPTRRIDREVLLFAYLAIPIRYYWAAIDWYGMFILFVPVWVFLFLPPLLVLRAERGLSARGRHDLLGPDDDGVHALPHGMAARVGRRRQSGRWRSRALVLPCGADPVQRCGAILLGQALRPPQGHAACQSEEDLGGADRRRRHDNARCGACRPLPHAVGYALVCAGRPHPRHRRLPRRHHHVGDEARSRREGHRRTDPGPWRHSRPRRQPTYAAPVFVHFVRYFYYP